MRRLRLWAWIKRKLKPVKPLPMPPYVPYCPVCEDHGYRTKVNASGLRVYRCTASGCGIYLTDRAAGAKAQRDLGAGLDLSIELLKWIHRNPKLAIKDPRLTLVMLFADELQPGHLASDAPTAHGIKAAADALKGSQKGS